MVTKVGNNGPNTLHGTTGNDLLKGLGGQDTLWGYAGNDTLRGGAGNDWLYGGAGNDFLYGGPGNDHEYGGTGADRFFFLGGPTGKDFIHDFRNDIDTLVVSRSYGFNTAQDVVDAAHPSGGDTPIDLSGIGAQNLQVILLGYSLNPQTLFNDIVMVA